MYTSRRVHCDHEPDLVIVSGAGDLGRSVGGASCSLDI